MRFRLVVCVAVLALCACPPSPAPPGPDADASPPPAGDAPAVDTPAASSDVTAACAILQAAGCPEGVPTCPSAIAQALADGDSKNVTPATVACIARARADVASIRACPGSWCPP